MMGVVFEVANNHFVTFIHDLTRICTRADVPHFRIILRLKATPYLHGPCTERANGSTHMTWEMTGSSW